MLHTVNKSPFEKNSLESCLAHASKGSAILLIEDGVYGALRGGALSEKITRAMADFTIYALEPDLKARGVQGKVMAGIKLVDYSGFVDLVAANDKVQAWL